MMSLWNVQCSGVQSDENTRTEVDSSDVVARQENRMKRSFCKLLAEIMFLTE